MRWLLCGGNDNHQSECNLNCTNMLNLACTHLSYEYLYVYFTTYRNSLSQLIILLSTNGSLYLNNLCRHFTLTVGSIIYNVPIDLSKDHWVKPNYSIKWIVSTLKNWKIDVQIFTEVNYDLHVLINGTSFTSIRSSIYFLPIHFHHIWMNQSCREIIFLL